MKFRELMKYAMDNNLLDSEVHVACQGYSSPLKRVDTLGNKLFLVDDCGVEELENKLTIESIKTTPSPFTKKYFHIEGYENIYEGYSDGTVWNGWAKPHFPFEVAKKLLEQDLQGDIVGYNEEKDSFYIKNGADEIEEYEGFFIQVDGQEIKVYDIGAGCWVWESSDSLSYWGNLYENLPIVYINESTDEPIEVGLIKVVGVDEE